MEQDRQSPGTAGTPTPQLRLATIADVPRVTEINHRWIGVGTDPQADKSRGHLSGEPFSAEQIAHIVAQEGISVFTVNGVVGGYFLFDDWTDHAMTERYRVKLRELAAQGLIDLAATCPRAQVAIAADYQSLGMYGPLQTHLCRHQAGNYRRVFSYVAKDNSKRDVHARFGWTIVAEDGDWRFVVRDLI